jgi:hypothetical protein
MANTTYKIIRLIPGITFALVYLAITLPTMMVTSPWILLYLLLDNDEMTDFKYAIANSHIADYIETLKALKGVIW